MKVLSIVGTRPNFMKVAPIHKAFVKSGKIESVIIHTGQHYDEKMSKVFFDQLGMPAPDINLEISGGTNSESIGKIMLSFEKVLLDINPDVVLVVGDVNSTLACGLVASHNDFRLVHVEAGLRSGDLKMPEEKNRILVDHLADYLFVTEPSGLQNLAKEGIDESKIHYVGNVMIDSLVQNIDKFNDINILPEFGLTANEYSLITLHRPSNVDKKEDLTKVVELVKKLVTINKVFFPIHPRTRNRLEKYDLFSALENLDNLVISGPQGYLEFMNLVKNASLILTDSGGIQEESSFLGVPCITFRDSTERPSTIDFGTNVLISNLDIDHAFEVSKSKLGAERITPQIPFWDGHTSERITRILLDS